MLDNDTCRLLMVHASFKPVPGAARTVINTGVVSWKIDPWLLEARKAVNAEIAKKKAPTPRWGWSRKAKAPRNVEIATATGETQICKRVPRTGSLAATDRICRSKEDWAKTNEANGIWSQTQGRQGTGIPN